jgi:hypothetical protein
VLPTTADTDSGTIDGAPTGSITTGMRGGRLIAAVVRPQGASHIQAQLSNAIPTGPTTAQRMMSAQTNRRRRVDIAKSIARGPTRPARLTREYDLWLKAQRRLRLAQIFSRDYGEWLLRRRLPKLGVYAARRSCVAGAAERRRNPT